PQIFASLESKFMPSCPDLPETCLRDHIDIRETDANLHNPGFLARAMACFMGEGLRECGKDHLLIKNK
ncbi:Hypothetical protein FKW44_023570, partial [Caligus rogercresseyi]